MSFSPSEVMWFRNFNILYSFENFFEQNLNLLMLKCEEGELLTNTESATGGVV